MSARTVRRKKSCAIARNKSQVKGLDFFPESDQPISRFPGSNPACLVLAGAHWSALAQPQIETEIFAETEPQRHHGSPGRDKNYRDADHYTRTSRWTFYFWTELAPDPILRHPKSGLLVWHWSGTGSAGSKSTCAPCDSRINVRSGLR